MKRHLAILLAAVLAACTPGDGSGGDEQAASRWTVPDTPTVVIGADESLPGHTLNRVGGVHLLADGGLALVNRGDSEIRVFDAAGNLERRIGGQGEGPQEFRGIMDTRLIRGDTLLVLERSRLSWVVLTGTAQGSAQDAAQDPARDVAQDRIVRRIRFDPPDHPDPCVASEGLKTLMNGPAAVFGWRAMGLRGCPASPDGAHREAVELRWVDLESMAAEVVGTFPGQVRRGLMPARMGADLIVAPFGDGAVIGETGGSWIQVYDPAERTLDTLPSPVGRLPLDSVAAEWVEYAVQNMGLDRAEVAEYFERPSTPDSVPAFSHLLTDPSGRIWVGRYTRDGVGWQEWVVVDPSGAPVAAVTMPGGVELKDVRDGRVAGLWRDRFEVEHVGVFPLTMR